MELLIAVLIAFGVVTGEEASKLNNEEVNKRIETSKVTQDDIDKQAAIIGLEEAEM